MDELPFTPRSAFAGILAIGRHGRPDGPPGVTFHERENLALASVIARNGQAEALAALVERAYAIPLPETLRRVDGPMPDGRHAQLHLVGTGPVAGLRRGLLPVSPANSGPRSASTR